MNSLSYSDKNKSIVRSVLSTDDDYLRKNDKKGNKYLDLPRNNIRRTSLPSSDEKSPKSPRKFLEYIKVSFKIKTLFVLCFTSFFLNSRVPICFYI